MSGKQRTVLVTGGTDGLGRAAAMLLAERGYRVFAAGRSAPKRQELDRLAFEKKLPLESVELDVCDDASVQRALETIWQKAGSLDVLVNNAGVGYIAVVNVGRLPAKNVAGIMTVSMVGDG